MAGQTLTSIDALMREVEKLRARLAEAENKLAESQQVIDAIRSGEVDAVVVSGPEGEQVFTLKDAEYAYRSLVEAMNEGAATLDAKGTVLYCNQRLSDLLGTPIEQIIGGHVTKLVAAEAMHDFEALFARAVSGEACNTELDFLYGQDNKLPVYVSLRAMHSEAGALCLVVNDLTERNKRDRIIANERQRLFDVLETVPAMVCLLTPDYHVAFANRGFREYFGESHGRRCYEYCYGERTKPCEFCETYEVLKTGKPHHWEMANPDGSVFSVYDFPFIDVDGSPLILEMDVDITAHRRAEESLRRANAYNRSLLEASLDPLVTIGPDGKITDVNAATEGATGYTRSALIGTDFCDFFTEPDKARAGYQQVFLKGFVRDYPLELRHRRGHLTPVLYNASVYCDESGNVVGVFAAARDITERRRAEAELAKHREKLEELVKERTSQLDDANAQLRADIEERKRWEKQLQRLNRTLKAKSDSSQALLHVSDESSYLQEVCRIVTQYCGHALMWIGFAENDKNKTVRPVASAGFEDGYLEITNMTWDDSANGRGPTGTAIRTGKPAMCRNILTDPKFLPWREEASKRGYASSLVIPLIDENKAFGVLNVYSRVPDGFSIEEVSMLTELAADLSLGIRTLRLRAAHAQAEEALRASEIKHRDLSNSIPALLWATDAQGFATHHNRQWYEYTGQSIEEGFGDGWKDVICPEDLERVCKQWDHCVKTGEDYAIEYRIRRASDGMYRWHSVQGSLSKDEHGKPLGWFGTFVDIHDRKQNEIALRESRQQLQAIIDGAMETIIFVKDLEGRFVTVNSRFEKMLGITRDEVRGKTDYEILTKNRADYYRAHDQMVLTTGRPMQIEELALLADGKEHVLLANKFPLFDANGKPYAVCSISADITDRKRAQEALIRSEKLASVGRMASTIAHEINNPLETIGNVIYLVSTNPDVPSSVKGYLDIAVQELERVTHISRQTLAFHRGTSTPTLMDLRESIDSITEIFAGRLESRRITVRKRCPDVGMIRAIACEIQQVISNLLSNSLDATPENGRIEFHLSRTNGKIRFTIADTGSGIPKEQMANIFEPFFTTKELHGTGLGLWVIKQIVDKHGATIRVRSKMSSGTVFSIVFPAVEVTE
ncbi:MAG: hypothetical protein CXZ00_12575 [Acidobacteria bacterium]|nr:MAG: hypothetical protein CXZ00_12575 [Acidobacteriota bacterium]